MAANIVLLAVGVFSKRGTFPTNPRPAYADSIGPRWIGV
jgi:hypothetical protein